MRDLGGPYPVPELRASGRRPREGPARGRALQRLAGIVLGALLLFSILPSVTPADSSSASAQPTVAATTYQLVVQVRSSSAPLDEALVMYLTAGSWHMLGKPTTSTGDTSASFADGTYELQVYEPGYVTQFQNETISGAAKSVTITLSTFVTQTPSYPTPIRHVIVIMDENLENNTALAEPYQGSLAKNYGYAANFWS
ncbi:MAG: hypothetical protein WA761_08100, partial [Thermoplasmata archaeon]